ncbi:MAG TPA: hypothetical protein VLC93_04810, partial [Myxococcota bacterium]|nr:hypothetical protein [Myxococcota bacterium]
MTAMLGLASLTACAGKDCKDLCLEGNSCEETTDDNIECEEFCAGLDAMTESNCGKEYDELLECERGADLCAENVCEDELNALGICALLYCGQDFDEPGCDDIRDGLSG